MGAPRILLVDDEESLVEMLLVRLQAAGYEVIVARDGREGLESARTQEPDLIVLDVMLPKLDGYAVCRMLKFDQKYAAIPVVLFTARAQESDRETGVSVGADAYIVKPFEAEFFMETIRGLLAAREGRGSST